MLEATHLILMVLNYAPSFFLIYKSLKALERENKTGNSKFEIPYTNLNNTHYSIIQ